MRREESEERNPSRQRRRASFWVLLVMVVEIGSFMAVGGTSASLSSHLAASPRQSTHAVGAAETSAAVGSLAAGGGPAGGDPAACNVGTDGVSGQCSLGAPTVPRPSASPLIATTPSWNLVPPHIPPARELAAMTFDAKDHYDLLFGGYVSATNTFLNDTWTYSSGTWVQRHPTVSPPVRAGAAMAYDASDHYVLLYGGVGTTVALSGTWKYSGGNWKSVATGTSPGPLAYASMAYDANDSAIVLFGGYNATGGSSGATWKFHAGVWTNVTPNPSPSARFGSSMAYDAKDGWVVLFGGVSGLTTMGDGWNFSHGHWNSLPASGAPPAREFAALAYSTADGVLVLTSGVNINNQHTPDTWTFVAQVWTKMGPAFHPSTRFAASAADGPSGSTLLLFGGHRPTGADMNDTWSYTTNSWHPLIPQLPAVRSRASMVYDEADGYVLLFGGVHGSAPVALYGDTWTFGHGIWKHLHTAVSPPPRYGEVMAYDPVDGYVVLFGGSIASANVELSDTWTFVGGVWSQLILSPSATPPGLVGASMTYDVADGYLLLFGGKNFTAALYSNQTWTFSSGAWTELFPASAPPSVNEGSSMVYDSSDGLVVWFGWINTGGFTGVPKTWEYSAGVWIDRTGIQTSSPLARYGAVMVDDSFDGYVLLFGGRSSANASVYNDTWSFGLHRWSPLTPMVHPSARWFGEGVYDAADNKVVLLGGVTAPTTYQTDTWTY
ncbi:MAG: hypothetical protein L3K15_02890 [Thermoplasmata archaeon]|nr:hypothetical protein [Thermoplasmata archaeon]